MERISVFDIFKIGIGPSSSHTMGPWRAAQRFLQDLQGNHTFHLVQSIKIDLYGSLAKTGVGHGTDIALLLGLSGEDPVSIAVDSISAKVDKIKVAGKISLDGKININFSYHQDLTFHKNQSLPGHPNAMMLTAVLQGGEIFSEVFYSIGGGFIVKEGETIPEQKVALKFPIDNAAHLLDWTRKNKMAISEIVMENELCWRGKSEVKSRLLEIWKVMYESIYRGCHTPGILPGGLKVIRRAAGINAKLLNGASYKNYEEWLSQIKAGIHSFPDVINWISCFALAVNEENASFSRVVTAPTNGAAGVIPAVMHYFIGFCKECKSEDDIVRFMLTAGEVGSLFKKGATISAAMGGCQAEIGVSSAMAAAALTECLGGTPEQALMAAEIAMEHHLGMTCDPIGGLVQIPCIERNSMGAIKAITASQLALQSDPANARVSLDGVIRTMWNTALDMNTKYKETSEGGLALNLPVNISEC